MPKCKFRLEQSQIEEQTGEKRPQVLRDAIQAIECTWMRTLDGADRDRPGELSGYEPPYHDFNGITSKFGAHFILRVDRILMKKQYSDAIIRGVEARDFPPLPVDYGYRDSKNFWFHRKRRMRIVREMKHRITCLRKERIDIVRHKKRCRAAADSVDRFPYRKHRTKSGRHGREQRKADQGQNGIVFLFCP
jgi:hypothetical protein